MTFLELTKYNKSEVRSDSNLTLYFMSAYEHIFKRVPICSGCSINNEINSLYSEIKKKVNLHDEEILINQKQLKMVDNNKTFEKSILMQEDLIAYIDENGRVRRKFTNKLNDEFVIGYLTNGTPEEIEERKKKFKVLPLALREEVKEEKVSKKKRSKK